MAESVNLVKYHLAKVESARQISCIDQMRKSYADIMIENQKLISETEKKNNNTKLLADSMKIIGEIISTTANVRYDESK